MAKKKLINREISWLAFNQRVLGEAADPTVPIMERLKFLGIFSNNRDEFFRVRVASVKRMVALKTKFEESGDDPKTVFDDIQKITLRQQQEYESIYKSILADLQKKGVIFVNEHELNEEQQNVVIRYFRENVDPIIGPVMLHQIKHFPELRDKAIYLAAILTQRDAKGKASEQHALIEVPLTLPRFVQLPESNGRLFIMMLDDIIRFNLRELFAVFRPEHVEAYTFKITRDAELDLDNDISKSFLEKVKKSLKERKRGAPVRFVYDSDMPKDVVKYLAKKMNLVNSEDAFIPGGRYHNLRDLMNFPKLPLPGGYYEPMPGHRHPQFDRFENAFHAIRSSDIMLHTPYQSFNHVIDTLKDAALDPDVRSIRICMYRVAKQSKVVNALINAARNGKKVIAVFELQARFDEENNIFWARALEDEGVKVHFGFPGLKVHGKICLITRKEEGQNNYYGIVSSGNFNESTSTTYTDFTLFTADPRITKEIHKVFELFEHAIWPNYRFKHLILSPFYLRNKLMRFINKEIVNAKAGKEAYVVLKINSLIDQGMINKIYEAAQNGVRVKLIVRGMCALVPGVKGMSENVEVYSIIDRFLEHARCYVFCNGGDPLYFISSADWMVRNLDRRIEVTAPIYDPILKREIDEVLHIQFADNLKARTLLSTGDYAVDRSGIKPDIRSQYALYEYYKNKSEAG